MLLGSGCADKRAVQVEGYQEINQKADEEKEMNNSPKTDEVEEEREYILSASILEISGITAEELAESCNNAEDGHYYFNRAVANEDGSMSYFLTETQRKNYIQREKGYIEEHIKDAYHQHDIEIEGDDDYREIKFIMGEKSSSAGFQVFLVKIATQVGSWQILNGCEPEEWGFHFVVEREGKTILDVNIPKDKWTLTNEDFGE